MSRPLQQITSHITKRFPEFGTAAVLDVGGNIGQSVRRFRALFPQAQIHSFEPAPETFAKLTENVGMLPNVYLNNCALGIRPDKVPFTHGLKTGNQALSDSEATPDRVQVQVQTGDAYCAANDVTNIDLLKVDTEGYDLDVLAGFTRQLSDQNVTALMVECTTNLDNRFHVHLERFIHFLHPYNYRLAGLIEGTYKIFSTRQDMNGMWFANAVFVREVAAPRLRQDGRN